MNILMVLGLHEHKLDNLLKPLVSLSVVKTVFLVRRRPFSYHKAVCYASSEWLQRIVILAEMKRVLTILYLCLSKKIDRIVGINFFPHCLYAGFAAFIFRKPLLINIIEDPTIYKRNIFFKPILRSAKHVFVRGQPAVDYLVEKVGVHRENVSILRDVLDLDVPVDEPQPKEFDLIFVSYLTSAKRVDLLCEVISRVAQEKPDLSVAIVGSGPEEKKLRKYLKEFRVEKNVSLFGHQPDVYPFLRRSRVMVLTSDNEGLPFVCIEAMICEVPFVAFRVGDITDIGKHEGNAMLAEPLDTAQFAGYCLRLLEDRSFYEKLVTNNQKLKKEFASKYTQEALRECWERAM